LAPTLTGTPITGSKATGRRGAAAAGYKGEPEGSKVPSEWHAWLHHTVDELPGERGHYAWEKPHQPNLTGTPLAYHPQGSVLRGGHRARATGDYEPWSPE
jgi:NADH:ubiquinone oxidoreductase subunit